MDFEVKYKNERDVEIPLLLQFIRDHPDIEKALDVGCARSLYACQVKDLVKAFDCIDFEKDEGVSQCYDQYFVGDLLEKSVGIYDLVFAISAIEHYGVKHKFSSCPICSQLEMVRKMTAAAKKNP